MIKQLYFVIVMLTVLVVVGVKSVDSLVPYKTTVDAIGLVQDIQMANSAFHVMSTVKTTVGIFQVEGAVSAKVGDTVNVKKKEIDNKFFRVWFSGSSEVCIERSQMKSDCYSVIQ